MWSWQHVLRRPTGRSITTAQAPQSLPTVLIRALVWPRRQSGGDLHPLREFDATGLARRAFYITTGGLGRRPAPRGNGEHRAFELHRRPYERHRVAGTNLTGGLHPVAVDMHLAARNGLGRQGAGFEQAHPKEPAIDARSSGAFFRAIFGHEPSIIQAMKQAVIERLRADLEGLKEQGLYKSERVLAGPQGGVVRTGDRDVVNLCANNYLGLANHPSIREAAHRAIDRFGYGMASVRFICGTQSVHKQLEDRLSLFLSKEDTILYSSCFDANGGLFETLLDESDAVISDALNHASIIDGIRLCKAQRYRYANNDMAELENCLKQAAGARTRLIATDGVFSMDGTIANLRAICDLADQYDALVMVDDSHSTGFMGATGRGTPEHCGVADRIDILTGTLGKALGGASGGYIASRKEIVEWLRQRSRPYLFSNSIPPVVAGVSLRVLDLLDDSPELRTRLFENARHFRAGLEGAGFTLKPGEHPIIPVMLGDAALASRMADQLLQRGIYVIGFSFPVVPKGQARIRTQMSAALTREQLDRAIAAFTAVGRELGVIH
jgi:glycine C-acetyltransferase